MLACAQLSLPLLLSRHGRGGQWLTRVLLAAAGTTDTANVVAAWGSNSPLSYRDRWAWSSLCARGCKPAAGVDGAAGVRLLCTGSLTAQVRAGGAHAACAFAADLAAKGADCLSPTLQVVLAQQMYDYVDARIRMLDADLRRFDAELAQDRRRAGLPVSLASTDLVGGLDGLLYRALCWGGGQGATALSEAWFVGREGGSLAWECD